MTATHNSSSAPFVELHQSFPSYIAAISAFVDELMRFIRLFMGKIGTAREAEEELEIAIHEALANAVVHGAKEDPNKIVECLVACDEERGMLIMVRDPGSGFDPTSLPDPCHGENVFSSHGRGIFLINQLMDEVGFHKNGTEIHMVKK